MKHQGQAMSETISMMSLGLAFMRGSFLLVATAICPGADYRLQECDIIPS